jgi:hypothetical protein
VSPCGWDSLILPCGFPPQLWSLAFFPPPLPVDTVQRFLTCPSFLVVSFLGFPACRFAAAKVFRIHLRPAFPQTSRAPRGLTVGEGPLAAASPQTPLTRGERTRLRASLGRAENSRRKRLLVTLPSVFLLDFLLVVPDIKVISQSSIPALFFLFFGSWVDLSFLFNFDQGNAFLELRARSVGASIMS